MTTSTQANKTGVFDEILNEIERLNIASVAREHIYLFLSRDAWMSMPPEELVKLASSGFIVWQENAIVGKAFIMVREPESKIPHKCQ